MASAKIELSITEMDIFVELAKIMLDLSNDERVGQEIRNEYINRANKVLEKKYGDGQ